MSAVEAPKDKSELLRCAKRTRVVASGGLLPLGERRCFLAEAEDGQ